MPHWTEGDVTTNGIRTHYYRTGGAGPQVVLAHGMTDNGPCWTRVARALEGTYDVVMYDARGHGLSEAPATGYTTEERATDLADLIRTLDLQRPALMGHSMGADTAAMAAATYPDLVRCAILEDPPWRTEDTAPPAGSHEAMLAAWRAEIVARKAHTRDELIAACRVSSPGWAEEELGPWADSKLQVSPNILNWLMQPRTPWQQTVQAIACPVLLITADPAKGGIVTPEVAAEASSSWHHSKVVSLGGAGHNIRREQYGPFMASVTAFLREA